VPGRASDGPVAVRHIGVPVAELNPPGWPAWPPGVTASGQARPACEHMAVPLGTAVSTQRWPSTTTSPPPLSTPLKGPTTLAWSCCPRVHESRMKSTFSRHRRHLRRRVADPPHGMGREAVRAGGAPGRADLTVPGQQTGRLRPVRLCPPPLGWSTAPMRAAACLAVSSLAARPRWRSRPGGMNDGPYRPAAPPPPP
jgi:hypothetical protein